MREWKNRTEIINEIERLLEAKDELKSLTLLPRKTLVHLINGIELIRERGGIK